MHACMIHMLTTRLAPHDCLMCSQAAARQCSLHTMDMNGYTSRGPLHSMVVHAVVQWLPSLCCMCRPRTIARSTSLSACSACVVRGRSERRMDTWILHGYLGQSVFRIRILATSCIQYSDTVCGYLHLSAGIGARSFFESDSGFRQ